MKHQILLNFGIINGTVRLYRFEITFAVIVCRVIFFMGGLNDEKDRNDG